MQSRRFYWADDVWKVTAITASAVAAAALGMVIFLMVRNTALTNDINDAEDRIGAVEEELLSLLTTPTPSPPPAEDTFSQHIRSISGFGYNPRGWGAAGTPFSRIIQPLDWMQIENVSSVNERLISLAISNPTCASTFTSCGLNQLFVGFGQLLDHDTTLVSGCGDMFPAVEIDITNDTILSPGANGTISLERKAFFVDADGNKQYNSGITVWYDASFLYGSDEARSLQLRTLSGGAMKMWPQDSGDLLPVNVFGEDADNQPLDRKSCTFVCGDIRCQEQPVLTAWHTVFLRFHNIIAEEVAGLHPTWTDEQVFQYTRNIVIGVFVHIVYDEFLPAMFQEATPLPPLPLEPLVPSQPPLQLHFAAASWRLGHTLVPNELWLAEQSSPTNITKTGELALLDAFFNSTYIVKGGIEQFLLGAAIQPAMALDSCVVDNLQNHLFMAPLDLLAINIARGRELMLPTFNVVRDLLSLDPIATFDELTGNSTEGIALAANLTAVYGTNSTEGLDLFVGLIAEQHLPSKCMGETLTQLLKEQFTRIRDCDPYYYAFGGLLDTYQLDVVANTGVKELFDVTTGIDLDTLFTNPFMVVV